MHKTKQEIEVVSTNYIFSISEKREESLDRNAKDTFQHILLGLALGCFEALHVIATFTVFFRHTKNVP